MHEHIESLVPALEQLHAEGDVDDALRLVRAVAELAAGTAGLRTAAALMDIGDGFTDGPTSTPLSCLGVARSLFEDEDFDHGVGSCDVIAAELLAPTSSPRYTRELFEQGIAALDEDVEPAMVGRAYRSFGKLRARHGSFEDALEAHRSSLDAYRRTGHAGRTAECHVQIAQTLHALDRPDDVLEPLAAARALFLEFGAAEEVADVDDRRGLALCDLGRYEEAEVAHGAAVARYIELDEEWFAARSRRYRSHPLDHLGRHAEAISELEAARMVLAEYADPADVARCDAGLGAALLGIGETNAARVLLDGARRVLEDAGEDAEAQWCAQLLVDPDSLDHRHPERTER